MPMQEIVICVRKRIHIYWDQRKVIPGAKEEGDDHGKNLWEVAVVEEEEQVRADPGDEEEGEEHGIVGIVDLFSLVVLVCLRAVVVISASGERVSFEPVFLSPLFVSDPVPTTYVWIRPPVIGNRG